MKRILSYIWDYLNSDVYVHHKLNFVPNIVMNTFRIIIAIAVILAVVKYIVNEFVK